MDHGLSGRLTNTMFFLAPEPHIIVITGLCQSPGALRTDIGGQMDTGGAAGDTRLLPLISARMPLFIVFSSDTFLQTRTWMSENTFPKALIEHTSPRVHPRRFRFPQTFESKHQSQEQCCYYKTYKNKESKIITT